MGITFNSLVMSNSHQSTAVVLKDFGIDVSLTSTSCPPVGQNKPLLRNSAVAVAEKSHYYAEGVVESHGSPKATPVCSTASHRALS